MTLGPSGIGRLPVAFWQTSCQSRASVCVARAAVVLMPEKHGVLLHRCLMDPGIAAETACLQHANIVQRLGHSRCLRLCLDLSTNARGRQMC